jgi:hypothetical protein
MKTIITILAAVLLSVPLITTNCPAQSNIKLEGIMQDPSNPIAIINGNLVQVGDKFDGLTVAAIGADFVKFQKADGSIMEVKLNDPAKTKEGTDADQGPDQKLTPAGQSGSSLAELDTYVRRADVPFKKAQAMLARRDFIPVAVFKEALKLYDKAERELQYGLEKKMTPEDKEKLKKLLQGVRVQKEIVLEAKRRFEMKVKTAVKNKQIVLGMTDREVQSAWGQPAKKTAGEYKGKPREQWIYGDHPRVKILYFEDGVLVEMMADG